MEAEPISDGRRPSPGRPRPHLGGRALVRRPRPLARASWRPSESPARRPRPRIPAAARRPQPRRYTPAATRASWRVLSPAAGAPPSLCGARASVAAPLKPALPTRAAFVTGKGRAHGRKRRSSRSRRWPLPPVAGDDEARAFGRGRARPRPATMEAAIPVPGDDRTHAPGRGRSRPRPATTEPALHGGASRSRAPDGGPLAHEVLAMAQAVFSTFWGPLVGKKAEKYSSDGSGHSKGRSMLVVGLMDIITSNCYNAEFHADTGE
ncbi:uncharacterized protein [Miscanthus floridulus]|uniref:uncharacterized protein n=1 Tax=Miscanthus floridulus TaxID=154761 RepID=UPI00345A672E